MIVTLLDAMHTNVLAETRVNLETIVVVICNGLTAILAVALVLIALWQAPEKRINRALAVMMSCLAFYSVLNAFARFLGFFPVAVQPFWYVLLESYGLFLIATLIFSIAYIGTITRRERILSILMAICQVLNLLLLHSGLTVVGVIDNHDGSFSLRYGPLFVIATVIEMSLLLSALGLAIGARSTRGRALIPPLTLIGLGLVSTLARPLFGALPVNALLLALAALLIGRAVINDQLFNPLAELNKELRRKRHELELASQLKNQFLANMSYELRTPLNSIIGYTGLILDSTYGPITEKQANRLEKVEKNSRHLLSLIDDLIDLSRIESGQLTLNLVVVSVETLLDNVMAVIEPLAAEKSLALRRIEGEMLAPLLVDEQRARQILVNILSNAVKFTPTGSVTVRAIPLNNPAPNAAPQIRFEVEDTGIGIPADQQAAVFEEFRQVDGSVTRAFQGTGLGLTITQRLVKLHGGSIELRSELGQGTTVTLTLPCVATSTESAALGV